MPGSENSTPNLLFKKQIGKKLPFWRNKFYKLTKLLISENRF